jgi:2-hydroxychromene-2-carboxylate isomerase
MGRRLEFFYDYGSPFSYLVDTQLPTLCQRTGAELVYRPMLLGGVFKATGNRSPIQEPVDNKRNYGMQSLQRWVEHYAVPFQLNPHFPINTVQLMRGALAAQGRGVFDPYHRAIFDALWAQGENVGDARVVASVLERAGVDAKPLLEATADPEIKQQLRASTDEACERGAFGAPTFFVGDQMFFGNDHVLFLEQALAGS